MNLLLCCIIHLVIGSVYADSVLYNLICNITNWSKEFLVLGFSITILSLGISACFYRKLYESYYIKDIIIISSVVWILSNGILWLSVYESNTILYITSCIFRGSAIGVLYASTISLVTEQYSSHRGITNGLVVMSFGVGSLLSANLYGFSINIHNIILLISIYGIALLLSSLFLRDITIITSISLSEVIKDTNWRYLSFIFFLNIGIGITLLSNLVDLSVQNGFTIEFAIQLVAVCGLANGFGRIFWSSISEIFGRLNTLCVMFVIQCIALLCLHYLWFVCVIIIISIYGGVFALMPSICSELLPSKAVGYSALLVFWGLAGLTIPNIYMTFVSKGLLVGLSILLLFLGFRFRDIISQDKNTNFL